MLGMVVQARPHVVRGLFLGRFWPAGARPRPGLKALIQREGHFTASATQALAPHGRLVQLGVRHRVQSLRRLFGADGRVTVKNVDKYAKFLVREGCAGVFARSRR